MENFNFSDYQKKTTNKKSVVLFGGSSDKAISVSDVEEAFELDFALCNKSSLNLSVRNAKTEYMNNVESLDPESVLIHLGDADYSLYNKNPADFDINYLELIFYIKSKNPKCRIGLVGLENANGSAFIDEMNRRIKYIADSEKCVYINLDTAKLWKPNSMKKVFSFISQMGLEKKCNLKKPLSDIAEMIYGYSYTNSEQLNKDEAMRA